MSEAEVSCSAVAVAEKDVKCRVGFIVVRVSMNRLSHSFSYYSRDRLASTLKCTSLPKHLEENTSCSEEVPGE